MMLFYAVASSQTEKAVELFVVREQPEAFLADVKAAEPETAALLRAS